MIRYFFHIAYKGTYYRGWQHQPNVRSVQETIEKRLAEILRKDSMTIIGCGRTDAEVHASQYLFHTDLETPLPPNFKFILNKRLPKDIVLFEIIKVEHKLHARFGATRRTYDYFIHTQKDPFLPHLSSYFHFEKPLDLDKMKAAIAIIKKQNDFASFCKSPDKHNTTICTIDAINFYQDCSGKKLRFEIKANRFLRGMIRILVQKIVEIGEGNNTIEALQNCFDDKSTTPSGLKSAPPDGLYLSKIEYPFLELSTQTIFPIFDINWIEIK